MNKVIKRYSGRDLLSQIQHDFNRLLSPFEHQYGTFQQGELTEWVPNVDVKEEDKQFVIHADLPGVKAADIDVSMDAGILTIKGSRNATINEKKENYLRIERSSGSFMRQMTLPEAVDQDKIDAKCSDGVLTVTLPKKTQSVGRRIEVKDR